VRAAPGQTGVSTATAPALSCAAATACSAAARPVTVRTVSRGRPSTDRSVTTHTR